MTPRQIKAAIILAGDSQRNIANRLCVTDGAVTQVIGRTATSHRIQQEIARVIGKAMDEVWMFKVPK